MLRFYDMISVRVSRSIYLNIGEPLELWGPLDDQLQTLQRNRQAFSLKNYSDLWILKDAPVLHINRLIYHLIQEHFWFSLFKKIFIFQLELTFNIIYISFRGTA